MNEEDVRVQRTQRALQQAFMDLISEQSYEAISVRAIAQRANVGYKTFYRHYQDKETLLYAILGTWLAHLIGRPLLGLNFAQQKFEANLRFSLVRFRENPASISIYGGEEDETRK